MPEDTVALADQPITEPPPESNGIPFSIPLGVIEGYETSDQRDIRPGGLATRALPMPLMGMDESSHGGMAGGAVAAGTIEGLERYDASAIVDEVTGQPYGAGVYAWRAAGHYLDSDTGRHFAELATTGACRGVSADLGVSEDEYEITEVDEDGWPMAGIYHIIAGEIMGFTQVPFPAFGGCYIVPEPEALAAGGSAPAPAALPPVRPDGRTLRVTRTRECGTCADRAMVAATLPDGPPAEWFGDPHLAAPTPLTVTDTGQIFGHIATWGTCHVGIGDACVTPPRDGADYGPFRTGEVVCADGSRVAVGRLTLGTGHADLHLGHRAAADHYDNTGTLAGLLAAGDDGHGIWVAGYCPPWVSDTVRAQLRACPPSGDWRSIGGRLRLVGILAVNVPGFPVARVASGAPQALVAAGAIPAARLRPTGSDLGGVVEAAVARALAPILRRDRAAAAVAALRR